MQKSFSQVILLLIGFIYLFFGIFHLIFPEQIGLFIIHGIDGEIAILLQRFLGASYLLISILFRILKDVNNVMPPPDGGAAVKTL